MLKIKPMNPEVKKEWLVDLRSGKYKQGKSWLRNKTQDNGDEFCCLGVLCDTYDRINGENNWIGTTYKQSQSLLPDEVCQWAPLENGNPFVYYDGRLEPLSYLNDHIGLDFNQIADLIEDQL